MTELSLKAQFAQRVPTRAIDLVLSGSPEVVEIERGEWGKIRTTDAIFALRRRGLTMLKAKRAIEAAMDEAASSSECPWSRASMSSATSFAPRDSHRRS